MSGISNPIQVTLALPTYNEEKNIVKILDQSIDSLEKLQRTWEIIVIDNYSNDITPNLVKQYIKDEPRVRIIVHNENRLYSGSCATALREAKGQYVAIMDSDGQFVASDLPKFIEKLENGTNLVFGWRRKRNDPFMRLVMSAVFNLLGKLWLGYPFHDLNSGIRMFDQKFVSIAKITHRINMANPELYIRAKSANLKLDEVEIQHFERSEGATSHDFAKSWEIFVDVNKYFMSLRKELER